MCKNQNRLQSQARGSQAKIIKRAERNGAEDESNKQQRIHRNIDKKSNKKSL